MGKDFLLSQDLRPRHFGAEYVAQGGETGRSRRAAVVYNAALGRVWILAGDTKWAVVEVSKKNIHRFSHWVAAMLAIMGFEKPRFISTFANVDEIGWKSTAPRPELTN